MKKDFRYFNIIFLLLIIMPYLIIPNKIEKNNYEYVLNSNYIIDLNNINEEKDKDIIDVFYGTITAYTSYCYGCIGITASGYDVRNTIYYNDNEYGNIRIIAADKTIPFGTIVKISNIDEEIIAIVLDRGGAIGFGNFSQADLLCSDENIANKFGKKDNAKFEIIRLGF